RECIHNRIHASDFEAIRLIIRDSAPLSQHLSCLILHQFCLARPSTQDYHVLIVCRIGISESIVRNIDKTVVATAAAEQSSRGILFQNTDDSIGFSVNKDVFVQSGFSREQSTGNVGTDNANILFVFIFGLGKESPFRNLQTVYVWMNGLRSTNNRIIGFATAIFDGYLR